MDGLQMGNSIIPPYNNGGHFHEEVMVLNCNCTTFGS